jgi:hypothetical protein
MNRECSADGGIGHGPQVFVCLSEVRRATYYILGSMFSESFRSLYQLFSDSLYVAISVAPPGLQNFYSAYCIPIITYLLTFTVY